MKRGTIITATCAGCEKRFDYVYSSGRPRKWCGERCRKTSYDRECIDRGSRISGADPGKSLGRCNSCAHDRRSQKVRAAHIEAIRSWAATYGEPPAIPDWSPQAAARIKNPQRAKRDGDWPHATSVIKSFGTWNAAIEAAGFTPRRMGGFAENHQRRRTSPEAIAA